FREAVDAEEPALVLDAIEGRVPFDRLVHARDGARDQRVETAPEVALPARHGRDIGLHGRVAVALRDLRVPAREEDRLSGLAGSRLRCRLCVTPLAGALPCDLRRLDGRLFGHTFTRGCLSSGTLQTGMALNCAAWSSGCPT